MTERAADGAAVAGLAVADVLDRLVHQRDALAYHVGEFDVALARHRADLERAVRLADVGETVDLVEVDDVVGLHEPHVEHRHHRLPAGQQLGVVEAAEQRDGVADRARVVVAEGRWLHRCFRLQTSSLYITGKPCLNPKNSKSPKYGTARGTAQVVNKSP